jgi:toxin YhaV
MSPQHRQPARIVPVLEINGWKVFAHALFLEQVEALVEEVEKLREADPAGYTGKKKTKLLAAILKVGFEMIPQEPGARHFLQGNTLGEDYRHWHGAKFFESRYRLFFRYSKARRVIVLSWVNDDETLRTYGGKKDAYAVFKKMLDKGSPPDDRDTLLKEAEQAGSRLKKLHQAKSGRGR